MRTVLPLLLLAGLTSISPAARAASVGFPLVTTDTSGVRVSGVTVAIGGVTLTAGTPATVTGYPLAGGGGVSCSVTLANPGGGALYTLNYDASLTGDVYFPLTITKAGSTFAAITDAICVADASNSATSATQTTTAAQQANMIAALIAQGYTVSRAANLANADVPTSSRLAPSGLPTDYQQRNQPVTLPTAPAGYGGGGGGGDSPGVTTLLARLGTPVGATFSADFAAIPAAVWAYQINSMYAGSLLFDSWLTLNGNSSVIYSGSNQATTYTYGAGSTVGHSTSLTTNTAGKPVSRTYTPGTLPH